MTIENNTTDNKSTVENALVPVTPAAAEPLKLNFKSFLFGAYAATAVLAVYTIIQLIGNIFVTAAPYVAGAVLFASLTAIFLSIVGTLKKIRKSAKKVNATWDTYAAIAVLTVLGYFAAACVATFQPGANAAELWTAGATSAILWGLLFAGGKYGAELFRDGGK